MRDHVAQRLVPGAAAAAIFGPLEIYYGTPLDTLRDHLYRLLELGRFS